MADSTVMAGATEPLTAFGEGVWIASDPVRIVGTRLTANMTVLALGEGGLLLHSPVAMTPERRTAVEALGQIRHLYAPNTFHHRWLGAWAAAFPSARVHAPARLTNKRPELSVARAHGAGHGAQPEPAFAGVIDEVPIAGFRLYETAIVHRPSGTAIVADLVHNIGRPPGAWTKFYARTMGFYDRVALSRAIRWSGFHDRAAARRSLQALLRLSFDRLVVGHGTPIATGARQALAAAYAWLLPHN